MSDSNRTQLNFAALMCSRLCHDLVGPVGAVANGAELLAEGGSDMLEDAQQLIANSAGQAVRRLRFAGSSRTRPSAITSTMWTWWNSGPSRRPS